MLIFSQVMSLTTFRFPPGRFDLKFIYIRMTWRNVLLNHWLKTIGALKAYRSKAFTLIEIFERIKAAVTIDLYNICFMNKQNKRIVIDYWQFIRYILIPLQQIEKLAKLVELRGCSTVNLPYQIFCSTFSPSLHVTIKS